MIDSGYLIPSYIQYLHSKLLQKSSLPEVTSDAKWAVACTSITFAVTAIMVLLQLHPVYAAMVTNNKLEGAVCVALVAFWSGIVSIVSDASNNLAVRHSTNGECNNTVLNGNLYYFSWAAFVTSISLLVSYLRSAFGVDLVGEVKTRSQRLELWSGMLACSLVVMGASANIFTIDCNPVQDGLDVYCTRCKFGISIGVIGSVFAIVVVGMKLITATAPFVFEGVLGLTIAILDGCGVAFITVRRLLILEMSKDSNTLLVCFLTRYALFPKSSKSAEGPGSAMYVPPKGLLVLVRSSQAIFSLVDTFSHFCSGNLYYFTWLAFLISVAIVSSCYSDMFGGAPSAQHDEEKDSNGDIQIEQLPPDHQENF